MEAFKKVVNLGLMKVYYSKRRVRVLVTIEWTGGERGRLSIQGAVGRQLGGQIQDYIVRTDLPFGLGLTYPKVRTLLHIWKRWHLNDLTPGTPNQEHIVRQVSHLVDREHHYEAVRDILSQCGLLVDYTIDPTVTRTCDGAPVVYETTDELGDPCIRGYTYGREWLYEAVPEHVLEFLAALPAAKRIPSWY